MFGWRFSTDSDDSCFFLHVHLSFGNIFCCFCFLIISYFVCFLHLGKFSSLILVPEAGPSIAFLQKMSLSKRFPKSPKSGNFMHFIT